MIKKCLSLIIVCILGLNVYSYDLTTSKIPKDGQTLCTKELQQSIDEIAAHGGGRLTFVPGTYLSGTLIIRSGVEFYLEAGATLKGCTDPHQYNMPVHTDTSTMSEASNTAALIYANNADRISFRGEGFIDGQGQQLALTIDSLHRTGEMIDPHYNVRRNRPSTRPKFMFLMNCRDVTVEQLHFRNSAEWGLVFNKCDQLLIQNLNIVNRAYWNNDGIDLTGCRNVKIRNCHINTADDGICLKTHYTNECNQDIEISDCDIRSSASAIKFGTASYGSFKNIHIHNIRVSDTFRSAIAIESVDGADIDNILVERINAVNTGNPIFIRLGRRAGEKPGSVNHITIRDFKCEVPFGRPDEAYDIRGPEVDFFHNPFPSSICGIPDNKIQNVIIENVEIRYPGRASKGMAYMPPWRLSEVPEQVDKYPEFTMFGELPAWGFFVRHVSGLTFRNVRLTLSDNDFRPAFVFDDIIDLKMFNVVPEDSYFNKE